MIGGPAKILRAGRMVSYGPVHDASTVAWLNSEDLRHTFGLQRTVTLQSHRSWADQAHNVLAWAVLDQAENHCGNALLHVVAAQRSGYFQIYLGDASVRGRGLGREVTEAVVDFGFCRQGLHRIWLHTLVHNTVAESLYRKLGFVDAGLERDALAVGNGFVSQRRLSLLENEWTARHLWDHS